MLIDSGFEICLISEEVPSDLNMGWKRADWKMMKVAESMHVNIHGIVGPIPIFLTKLGYEQNILGLLRETQFRKSERNLDNACCEITVSAIDES